MRVPGGSGARQPRKRRLGGPGVSATDQAPTSPKTTPTSCRGLGGRTGSGDGHGRGTDGRRVRAGRGMSCCCCPRPSSFARSDDPDLDPLPPTFPPTTHDGRLARFRRRPARRDVPQPGGADLAPAPAGRPPALVVRDRVVDHRPLSFSLTTTSSEMLTLRPLPARPRLAARPSRTRASPSRTSTGRRRSPSTRRRRSRAWTARSTTRARATRPARSSVRRPGLARCLPVRKDED